MEEKKGISTGVKVVLLVIFVAIASVSSWFIGKNMAEERINETKMQQNSENRDNKDNDTKTETRELNSVEKTDLMKVIDELGYVAKNVDLVDSENPMSDSDIFKASFEFASNGIPDMITLDVVNLYSNKYFGKDVVPEDVPCVIDSSILLYKYRSDMERFYYSEEHGGHGASGVSVLNKFESGSLDGNIYTVSVYSAFTDETEFFYSQLYATYEDSTNRKNVIYDAGDIDPSEFEFSDLEKAFDELDVSKLNKYTYTFEKKNGNYILKSYKMN